MITTLAVENYRSLHHLYMPLSPLTVVTGANGVGKSNLYGALRLLVSAAQGRVVSALAQEGGLPVVMWAGPEKITRKMEQGEVPVQGSPNTAPVRVRLGFSGEDYGYMIELGLPIPSQTAFNLDPEIKRECIWHGPLFRPASSLVERQGAVLKRRDGRRWQVVSKHLAVHSSLFEQAGDPTVVPEVFVLRETIRQWRFYAEFRTDKDAPARRSMPSTRTPVLHHDGRDFAAALQTIFEVGDKEALDNAVDDAFPGSELKIVANGDGQLKATLKQPGLLRALDVHEWSDGTLRYLLLVAALLTPRPPPLMILNEPETSLHPDLIPALSRLVRDASARSQVWVISHSQPLVHRLESYEAVSNHVLEKRLGQTAIAGLHELDKPPWRWR